MSKRPLAVMTIVQDEREFMRPWLSHYLKQVPGDDIYILHHAHTPLGDGDSWSPAVGMAECEDVESDVDALDALDANIVPVHNDESFSHIWLKDTVRAFYAFLLQSYEWVLFSECDELVTPAPWPRAATGAEAAPGLVAWVERNAHRGRGGAFRALGYEVVHAIGGEPPLRRDEPWLPQRGRWLWSRLYSKTLLSSVPLDWCEGFHNPAGPCAGEVRQDPCEDLLLVHLHKVDFDMAMEKSRRNATRRWAQYDTAVGAGAQNRIVDEAAMVAYFLRNVDDARPVPSWADLPRELHSLV